MSSSRQIIKDMKKAGWYEVGQSGSHKQFKHPVIKGKITVPSPKKDLPKGTERRIRKDAGLI